MKANELRIGNWVSFYHSISGETFNEQIWPEWFISDADQNDSSPIPLTPEIFVLNGFGEDNNGHFLLDLQTHYLEIIPMKDGFYPMYGQKRETSGDNDNLVTLNRIDYVHQLQNLYFVLTGEELNIDLC